MNRPFSLYLDLVRFTAAVCVMLAHINMILGIYPIPGSFGHNAVVVFFVLSGYVIAFVTDTKENTPRDYWASRLSRIYSVALPAVLLTPLLDMLGEAVSPGVYANGVTTHDYWPVRIAASLAFVNELWLVSIMPFSNSPYWSLCYEMAYYTLYAVYCFTAGYRRLVWLALLSLLIGPKILLMFPIWLLGVLIYRFRILAACGEGWAWALLVASLLGIAWYQYVDVARIFSELLRQWTGERLYTLLHFSKRFPGDYLLALIIAANFIAFRRLGNRFAALLNPLAKPIRYVASYTFSLYLFHLPVALCATALWQRPPSAELFLLVLASTLIVVFALGSQTERRREGLRDWLKQY